MDSHSKDFLLGVISGAVIGGLVGMLYAPDKGSTTRDRLSYRLGHYLDELTQLIESLRNEQAIISNAKMQGDQVVEDAKKRAEELRSEVDELLKTINTADKE